MGYVQDHLACVFWSELARHGGSSRTGSTGRSGAARPDWRPCAAFNGPVPPGVGRIVDTSSFDELLDVDAAAQRGRTVAQEWTREVTQIIRGQAESSRVSGRVLAGGINVVTVSLMVTAFTMTGGLTGVEVGIAGASAALSQTILEAYFGERTVRSLAEQARAALERLAGESLSDVVAPVSASLDRASDKVLVDKLAAAVESAREVLA